MTRVPRIDAGGIPYHVINRANERAAIFVSPGDYTAFEMLLSEAKERVPVRLYAYCIMPNHWHMVLEPLHDGDLSSFMGWLTLTHSKRWRTAHASIGRGHLYQDRYRSFPIQADAHFLTVARYVERNALRAKLVERAETWRWSSAWRRCHGSDEQRKLIDHWPIPIASDYLQWLNTPQTAGELVAIRSSVNRGRPFGDACWTLETAKEFNIESTLRERGRPRKQP